MSDEMVAVGWQDVAERYAKWNAELRSALVKAREWIAAQEWVGGLQECPSCHGLSSKSIGPESNYNQAWIDHLISHGAVGHRPNCVLRTTLAAIDAALGGGQ